MSSWFSLVEVGARDHPCKPGAGPKCLHAATVPSPRPASAGTNTPSNASQHQHLPCARRHSRCYWQDAPSTNSCRSCSQYQYCVQGIQFHISKIKLAIITTVLCSWHSLSHVKSLLYLWYIITAVEIIGSERQTDLPWMDHPARNWQSEMSDSKETKDPCPWALPHRLILRALRNAELWALPPDPLTQSADEFGVQWIHYPKKGIPPIRRSGRKETKMY